MFNFEKLNPVKLFTYDTSSFDYVTQKEVYNTLLEECDGDEDAVAETPLCVHAIYINTKGQFGAQPVVALDDCYLSLPQGMVDTCREILSTPAAIKAINEDRCCIFIEKYVHPRYHKECYSFKFGNM